jgi:hypothetical protein
MVLDSDPTCHVLCRRLSPAECFVVVRMGGPGAVSISAELTADEARQQLRACGYTRAEGDRLLEEARLAFRRSGGR